MKPDRNGMVQMKARKGAGTWTRNSPTSAGILHGDEREGADVAAQYPYVTPEDAEFLQQQGLADPYDGKLPDGDSDLTLEDRAANQVEDSIDAENSTEATTGLSTVATTAFPTSHQAMAGEAGGRAVRVADTRTSPASEEEAPSGSRSRSGSSRSRSSGTRSRSGGSRSRSSGGSKASAPAPASSPAPAAAPTTGAGEGSGSTSSES